MSFNPKPCSRCAGKSFQVIPDLQYELWRPTTVLGVAASESLHARHTFTLVICAQCTQTEVYTQNGAELAHRVPGSYVATAT